MDTNKLIKISSITKKILIGLFGAFLLLFLLFHMCANLLILLHDNGEAYGAFCHFMGSDFVKIFEIILLACFVLHAVLAVWVWFENKRNRPVRPAERQILHDRHDRRYLFRDLERGQRHEVLRDVGRRL